MSRWGGKYSWIAKTLRISSKHIKLQIEWFTRPCKGAISMDNNSRYGEIIDHVNRLIEEDIHLPNFDDFFENQSCPYCGGDSLYFVANKIAMIRSYTCQCPACKKRWGVAFNIHTGERFVKEFEDDEGLEN
jgi:hypothetical protein